MMIKHKVNQLDGRRVEVCNKEKEVEEGMGGRVSVGMHHQAYLSSQLLLILAHTHSPSHPFLYLFLFVADFNSPSIQLVHLVLYHHAHDRKAMELNEIVSGLLSLFILFYLHHHAQPSALHEIPMAHKPKRPQHIPLFAQINPQLRFK